MTATEGLATENYSKLRSILPGSWRTVSVRAKVARIMQNGIKNTVSINWVARTTYPNGTAEDNEEHSSSTVSDWFHKQEQTILASKKAPKCRWSYHLHLETREENSYILFGFAYTERDDTAEPTEKDLQPFSDVYWRRVHEAQSTLESRRKRTQKQRARVSGQPQPTQEQINLALQPDRHSAQLQQQKK